MTFDSIFSLQNSVAAELPKTRVGQSAKRKNLGSKSSRSELIFGNENQLLSVLTTSHLDSLDDFQFPMVIYGPSGCGKSEIADIVSQNLCASQNSDGKSQIPDKLIFRANGNDFFRDFIDAINLDDLESFRQAYVKADLIVFDGLDELARRKSCHGELIFLLDHCKKIIATSLLHPSELDHFPSQITSRLLAGLCLPLVAPATDTKVQIIQQEIKRYGGSIQQDAAQWLAENESPSIPILKEKISQLRIKLDLQKEISLESIQRVFKAKPKDTPSLNLISKIVAKYQSLKIADLKSQSRKRVFVLARGLAIFVARNNYQYKFEEIGQFFGNRDHTTVMHAFQKIKKDMVGDLELKKCFDEILVSIQTQSN